MYFPLTPGGMHIEEKVIVNLLPPLPHHYFPLFFFASRRSLSHGRSLHFLSGRWLNWLRFEWVENFTQIFLCDFFILCIWGPTTGLSASPQLNKQNKSKETKKEIKIIHKVKTGKADDIYDLVLFLRGPNFTRQVSWGLGSGLSHFGISGKCLILLWSFSLRITRDLIFSIFPIQTHRCFSSHLFIILLR